MDDELPRCPLCDRPLVTGPSVNRHHLVPKSRGGKEVWDIHTICHSKIHSLFTEKELEREYDTWEKLQAHPDIATFIRWVRKKEPTFRARNATARSKGRR